MRISYRWLKALFPEAPDAEATAEILTNTGLEVEGIEPFESIPGGLNGLVVGEVLEVWKHPDADRLRLTRVHIGNGSELQIVCGAPNVAARQKVVVATEGTTLHPLEGDPFTIRKGKIRGELSQGMLCAEDEIGIGVGHDGIMVLPENSVPGTPIADVLGVYTDQCLEIGLTPNRTDAMSHMGVARDLRAALLRQHDAELPPLRLPSAQHPEVVTSGDQPIPAITVSIEAPEACHRYAGITLTGVTVKPSPDWLSNQLKAIGLTPINAVVDVTNYVMHELGQPLHAFDAGTLSGSAIKVRHARAGESFTTLDGTERSLSADDLMICDAEKPVCIAGVFGGLHSGITSATTTVFLESAVFDPVHVRRTARRHQLNTDASYRFERGVDASMVPTALYRAAELIIALTGGCAIAPATDLYPVPHERQAITVSIDRMNRLIGKNLPSELVRSILHDLDFEITEDTPDALTVLAPLCRRDVTREADVVEEVLRIYGYNNVEIPQRVHASVTERANPDTEAMHQRAADVLAARGFTEIMNNSLTKVGYANRYRLDSLREESAVRLKNPLSSDLGQLRQSLLFQGLETISRNINFRQSDLRLFEFGSTYHRQGDRIVERPVLALWLTGRKAPENWNNPNEKSDFTHLRSAVFAVIRALSGEANLTTHSHESGLYSDAIALHSGRQCLLEGGRLHDQVTQDADVAQPVYYAEIDWNVLVQRASTHQVIYAPLPKFPSVRRDLSLLLDRNIRFSDIESVARNAERKLLQEVGLFDVYEGKNLEPGKKSYALSFVLRDSQATLTDKKIDAAMSRILKALESSFNARLRS